MNKVTSIRCFCILILGILVSKSIFGQLQQPYSPNVKFNYFRNWVANAPIKDSASIVTKSRKEVKETTQYFDAIGRLIQQVEKKGALKTGDTSVDLVIANLYDEFGRETYRHMPFAANSTGGNTSLADGRLKFNPFQQGREFNNTAFSDTNSYTKFNYEQSPLDRILDAYSPGKSWVGSEGNSIAENRKSISSLYQTNSVADSVRLWMVNGNIYSTTAIYPADKLFKSVEIDENKNKHIIFKNVAGQIVLSKKQLSSSPSTGHSGWLCTYYLYDELERLRLVIQPKGVELLLQNAWNISALGGEILSEQCFRYEYDQRKRLIVKKIPGSGEVRMVYDSRDRLVLVQDPNLRILYKWVFTKYDLLNRPIATGLYTNTTATTQAAMQSFLDGQNLGYFEDRQTTSAPYYTLNKSFPVASLSDVLSVTYYDDYYWANGYGDFGNKDNSFDNLFSTSYSAWPFPTALKQGSNARGLITGSWDKSGIVVGNYYDENGQLIQTKTKNISTGIDIQTMQYNFGGKVLQTILRHQKKGTNVQDHTVITKYDYDELVRLKTVKQSITSNINGQLVNSPEKLVVEYEYNSLSQIKSKKLGVKPSQPNIPLAILDFEYNIRGWLTGINSGYVTSTITDDRFFGMQLSYDNGTASSIAGKQFNGNVSGMIWKNAADQKLRKYDFSYDLNNRLTRASFTQHVSGSGASAVYNISDGIDFNVDTIRYDVNGNILNLKQKGWKLGGSTVIDDLNYNYYNNSNKLKNVIDNANDVNTKLGDFRSSASYMTTLNQVKGNSAIDYTYDSNGNLIKDLNKDIDDAGQAIEYNHLNLPVKVKVKNKGVIEYVYDNLGNKISKKVTEGSKITTFLYIRDFEYKNDTLLQMVHEEGRVRFEKATINTCPVLGNRFVYDYNLKDHINNVRAVVSEEQQSDCYPAATLEPSRVTTEQQVYQITTGRIVDKNSIGATQASLENKLYRVHGGIQGEKTGLGAVVKVMSGDKVSIRAESFYSLPGGNAGSPVTMGLTELLASFIGNGAGAAKGVAAASDLINLPGNTAAFNNHILGNNPSINTAKAALNWILFDEQFKFVSAGFDVVQPGGGYKNHTKFINEPVQISKSGYLYIYVSNESNLPVYFDNLQFTHARGPLQETADYYPFGLEMNGIGSKAIGKLDQKLKFNNKEKQSNEFSDGSGLEWYDFGVRCYDPQIGRWMVNDPKSEKFEDQSPYVYSLNNPIRFLDMEGKEPGDPNKVRLIFHGGAKKEDDNSAFRFAANKLNAEYNKTGEVFEAISSDYITSRINAQQDNSIQSLDLLTHGSTVAFYMYKKGKEDNWLNVSMYDMIHTPMWVTNPLKIAAGIGLVGDINFDKFTNNAIVEIHGCKSGKDHELGFDNIAIDISESLFDAGKTDAVVIAHTTAANPNINGNQTKYEDQDYRHGERVVYHNGKVLFKTRKSGSLTAKIQHHLKMMKQKDDWDDKTLWD